MKLALCVLLLFCGCAKPSLSAKTYPADVLHNSYEQGYAQGKHDADQYYARNPERIEHYDHIIKGYAVSQTCFGSYDPKDRGTHLFDEVYFLPEETTGCFVVPLSGTIDEIERTP